MTRTFVAALLVALSITPAVAAPADVPQQRFTRAGYTFVYTAVVDGDRRIIRGRRYPGGESYRLVVRGRDVAGVSGGVPVSFRMPAAPIAATSVALASR